MSADDQAEHAALFKRVAGHLAATAGKLARLDSDPNLSALDVARLFVGTGAAVLLEEYGDVAAVEFLREYADRIDAGKVVAN